MKKLCSKAPPRLAFPLSHMQWSGSVWNPEHSALRCPESHAPSSKSPQLMAIKGLIQRRKGESYTERMRCPARLPLGFCGKGGSVRPIREVAVLASVCESGENFLVI